MDNYRIRELIEFSERRSRDYSLSNAEIAAFRDTAAALRELMQRSQPPVVQQPEARGVADVEAIRRACQSGKRFWQAGPGYYEEIESLLPALTEARNVR